MRGANLWGFLLVASMMLGIGSSYLYIANPTIALICSGVSVLGMAAFWLRVRKEKPRAQGEKRADN